MIKLAGVSACLLVPNSTRATNLQRMKGNAILSYAYVLPHDSPAREVANILFGEDGIFRKTTAIWLWKQMAVGCRRRICVW